jgi:general secretion pathway protein G
LLLTNVVKGADVKKKKKKEMGFSLIELLIVMVIMGLLAALVGPRMFGKVGKSKQNAAGSQMALFETALDVYRLDVGKYPSTEQGLQALRTKPSDEEKWDGPYLPKSVPKDPWGHPYVYSRTDNGEVEMISLGADGTEGGEGEDKDISSREGEEEDSG